MSGEGARLVLLSDVAFEMLLAAERAATPGLVHHVEYGVEHRDVVSYFVPTVTIILR